MIIEKIKVGKKKKIIIAQHPSNELLMVVTFKDKHGGMDMVLSRYESKRLRKALKQRENRLYSLNSIGFM